MAFLRLHAGGERLKEHLMAVSWPARTQVSVLLKTSGEGGILPQAVVSVGEVRTVSKLSVGRG